MQAAYLDCCCRERRKNCLRLGLEAVPVSFSLKPSSRVCHPLLKRQRGSCCCWCALLQCPFDYAHDTCIGCRERRQQPLSRNISAMALWLRQLQIRTVARFHEPARCQSVIRLAEK